MRPIHPTLSLLAVSIVAALTFLSCSKELDLQESLPGEETSVKMLSVKVHLNGLDPVTRSSFSTGESTVNNLTLLIYDSSGALASSHWIESPGDDVTVSLPAGTYTFAATANLGDFRSMAGSLDDWQNALCQVTKAMLGTAFPMSGSRSATVSASSTSVTIPLQRLVARYSIKVNKSGITTGTLTVNGLKVIKMAGGVRPASSWGPPTLSAFIVEGDTASSSDVSTLDSGGNVVFYVTENCQGVESSITSSADKNPSHSFSTVDPSLCTYMEVYCTYFDGSSDVSEITYRMYLGENATSSFNVRRNTSYTITLCPSSAHIEDGTWKCENDLVASVGVYNGTSNAAMSRTKITLAQNCYIAVTDEDGAILPISSCTSSTPGFSSAIVSKTLSGSSGACADLLISAAGSGTYHITTSGGLEFDYTVTSAKPTVVPSSSTQYLFLDGTTASMGVSWKDCTGAAISTPSTFFNWIVANVFVQNKPAISCTSAYRCPNMSTSSKVALDESYRETIYSTLDAFFASTTTLTAMKLRVSNYADGDLQSMLNDLQSSGYFGVQSYLNLISPYFNLSNTFKCMFPWMNRSDDTYSAIHDYSLIPEEYLASGLSHSGTITGFAPTRISSSACSVTCSLSRAYSSSYSSGITYTLPANSTTLSYSFSGGRHPAGRHTLSVNVTNKVSGETLSLHGGQLDCYSHMVIGPKMDFKNFGQGGSWYDPSSRETSYDVSLELSVRYLWTVTSSEDYPMYRFQYAMRSISSGQAMVQGAKSESGEHTSYVKGKGVDNTIQYITVPEVDYYPGCGTSCNLVLKHSYSNGSVSCSGDIGRISSYANVTTSNGLFPLYCYYSEQYEKLFNLYNFTGSTTVGSAVSAAHWYYNTSHKDDSGLGYYIVDKSWNVTTSPSWNHFMYGTD